MPDEDAERKYGYGEKMVSGPAQLAFVFGPDGCGSAEQAADKGWKQLYVLVQQREKHQ